MALNACTLFSMLNYFFNLPDILDSPEFNNSLPDLLCSDDDSGNEDALEMEYSETEAEILKRNAEVYTYQFANIKCLLLIQPNI